MLFGKFTSFKEEHPKNTLQNLFDAKENALGKTEKKLSHGSQIKAKAKNAPGQRKPAYDPVIQGIVKKDQDRCDGEEKTKVL